jgi:hypothetical protein
MAQWISKDQECMFVSLFEVSGVDLWLMRLLAKEYNIHILFSLLLAEPARVSLRSRQRACRRSSHSQCKTPSNLDPIKRVETITKKRRKAQAYNGLFQAYPEAKLVSLLSHTSEIIKFMRDGITSSFLSSIYDSITAPRASVWCVVECVLP